MALALTNLMFYRKLAETITGSRSWKKPTLHYSTQKIEAMLWLSLRKENHITILWLTESKESNPNAGKTDQT
mgnify:CR=1 FL=1